MQISPAPLLKVERLAKNFGGVRALNGIDFALNEGDLVGLIGPNGSGKTTAFNIVTGILKPSEGRITFGGADVTGNAPETNAALGMARTFQNIRLFNDLPVVDNVMVGLHRKRGPGFLATVLGLRAAARAEAEIRQRAMAVLDILGLSGRAAERVGGLPYGDQRKVEFARALASDPRLLLLDEPTAGMNPYETADLGATIARLHRELGITILLVEHDMKMVMGICQRLVVINQGNMLAQGTPAEIRADQRVVEAYLGHGRKGGRQRGPEDVHAVG
ncbi:ABC transporter ATP-binding protein [Mangrovicella endophytica]|uniref:ABC transporter ATP-binding protein n=1 Tax=Mangrovicella endophytica TaxID=2066697 RepID=UPI000C9E6FBB|nr:ABC transporter ATP-binding protein [Mangrovicella endophytica]